MEDGNPICPANLQQTLVQKYPRTEARANEHLRPLGRRKAGFWLGIMELHFKSESELLFLWTDPKSLKFLKFIHSYFLPDAKIPWWKVKHAASCVSSLSWNRKAQLAGRQAGQLNHPPMRGLCVERPRRVQTRSSAKIKMQRPDANIPHYWPSGTQSINIVEVWSMEDSCPTTYG